MGYIGSCWKWQHLYILFMTYSNVKLQAVGACSCDIPFGDSTKNASTVVPSNFSNPLLLYGTNRSPQTETMSLLLCGTHRSPPTGTNTIYTPFYVVVLTGLPELAPYSLRFMVPLGRSYPFFAWVSYIHTHSAFVKHEHYTTLWTSVAIYLHTLHYMYTANKPT